MPDPGDIFNVALRFALPEGVEAYNVYDFLLSTGSATDAELLTVIAAKLTDAYAFLQDQIRSTVNMQEGKVNKVIWSGTEWIVDRIVGQVIPTFTPTRTDDMLPHAVSPVVTFFTNTPKVRGRKFVPGFTEATQDESLLIGTAISALLSYGSEIFTGETCGAGNLAYVIASSLGIPIGPNIVAVDGIVGSQRRRKPGVGI